MQLNKDNFLIWEGLGFTDAPFDLQVNDDLASIAYNTTAVDIYPLGNDVASYGFNANSFEFTFQDNPNKIAAFDPVQKKVTYYPPSDVQPGETRILRYKIRDTMGHESGEATISINIQERVTAWRAYQPSVSCLLDGKGDNTGMKSYGQLEKYYQDNGAPVLLNSNPVLKDNVSNDPDYVPPVQDNISCPLPSQDVPFYAWNAYTFFNIVSIIFRNGGSPVHTFYPNFGSTQPQPLQLQVSGGNYDEIAIELENVFSGPASATLSLQPGAGGSAPQSQNVNQPQGIATYYFYNLAMGATFGADLYIE